MATTARWATPSQSGAAMSLSTVVSMTPARLAGSDRPTFGSLLDHSGCFWAQKRRKAAAANAVEDGGKKKVSSRPQNFHMRCMVLPPAIERDFGAVYRLQVKLALDGPARRYPRGGKSRRRPRLQSGASL